MIVTFPDHTYLLLTTWVFLSHVRNVDMNSVTYWYQIVTRCEELVPILHGVKGVVLLKLEISLKVICEKVKFSIGDYFNNLHDYQGHTYILFKKNLMMFKPRQVGDKYGLPLVSLLWCLTVSLSLPYWYPGSGVVLDCIDS